MLNRCYCLAILFLSAFRLWAQYPPPVGFEGTTAIFKDSSVFVGWASKCIDDRGYINIQDTTIYYNGSNKATYGHYYFTTGPADGHVMSLGDGGIATMYFDTIIGNGPGPDFAVFENSFSDTFLELAFVEVSSDGETFVRFPSVSLTPELPQVSTFDSIDTRNIHNLAGKYRAEYGTPFDLEDLKDSIGIDINHIIQIRIIDVVGCIDNYYACYDSQGHKINEPWPTSFDTGGFDLDAVGIIVNTKEDMPCVRLFPNPVNEKLYMQFPGKSAKSYNIKDLSGRLVQHERYLPDQYIDMSLFQGGIYFIQFQFDEGTMITRKIVRK